MKATREDLEPMTDTEQEAMLQEVEPCQEMVDLEDLNEEEKAVYQKTKIYEKNRGLIIQEMKDVFSKEIFEFEYTFNYIYGYLRSGYYISAYIHTDDIINPKNIFFDIGKYTIIETFERKPHFTTHCGGLDNIDLVDILSKK